MLASEHQMTMIHEAKITGFETAHENKESFIVYIIEVRNCDDETTWIIRRRYSEFLALHIVLKDSNKEFLNFDFPGKYSTRNRSPQSRIPIFDSYLKMVTTLSPEHPEIATFLSLELEEPDINISQTVEEPSESGRSSMSKFNARISTFNPLGRITMTGLPSFITGSNKTKLSNANIVHTNTSDDSHEAWFHAAKFVSGLCSLLVIAHIIHAISTLQLPKSYSHFLDYINFIPKVVSRFLMNLKFTEEIIIAVLFVLMTGHRFIGFAISKYLQSLLMNKETGAFHMSIDWISLRLGLDHNELVVSNFIWHNPVRFAQTPYFVRVKQLTLVLDLTSIYKAIAFGSSIHIFSLELDAGDVYIEKAKDGALNLWACLGSGSVAADKSLKKRVEDFLKAVQRSFSDVGGAGAGSTGGDDCGDSSPTRRYNPFSLLRSALAKTDANDDDDTTAEATAPPISQEVITGDINVAVNNAIEVAAPATTDSTVSPLKSPAAKKSFSAFAFMSSSSSPSPTKIVKSTSKLDIVNGIAAVDTPSAPQISVSVPVNVTAAQAEAQGEAEVKGWGVPYTFIVDRLTIRNLKVHAQDLLNAQHVDHNSAASIHVKLINMVDKELTKPPKGGPDRRGLYLDGLVGVLINKLIIELLATNKLALMAILTSAAASQTTTALFDGATMAAMGVVDNMYTYNPLEVLSATTKTIKHVTNKVAQGTLLSAHSHTIDRSPSVAALQINKLMVKVIKGKNLVHAYGKKPSLVVCVLRLINDMSFDNDDLHRESDQKTSSRSLDREGMVAWNESVALQPVLSLQARLRVQIFERSLLHSDNLLGECFYSLKEAVDSLTTSTSPSLSPVGSSKPEEILNFDIINWHSVHRRKLRLKNSSGTIDDTEATNGTTATSLGEIQLRLRFQ